MTSDVTRRNIPHPVRLMLYVRAGGRCEFDGCNKYLLENDVTFTAGNYGQAAHIVAFKRDGPRGREGRRPTEINDVANLMLLCPGSHKEIDDHPEKYSVRTLKEYKRNHEARIKHVTSLDASGKTAVFVLKAPINGDPVSIPFEHVVAAAAPRYPARPEAHVVDLTTISDRGDGFLKVACETVKDEVDRFLGTAGEGRRVGHASIFAMGPIPLLIFLGTRLSNKIPTDLFQRHRGPENWTWKRGRPTVDYSVRVLRAGSRTKVALVLSLSGTIRQRDLPSTIRNSTIYAITLKGQVPQTGFLQTRADLDGFRVAFQEAMGLIAQKHGKIRAIDLFPAVPAPIAVLCGRELLNKIHPALRIWDFNKRKGGFIYQLEVN